MRKLSIDKYTNRMGTAGLNLQNRRIVGPATIVLDENCIISQNMITHTTPKTGMAYGSVPTDHFTPVIGLRDSIISYCHCIDIQFVIPFRLDKRKKKAG